MSVQKQDHPSVKVAVVGVSGTGKSTLFEKLVKREKAGWKFLYDHKGGYLAGQFGVKPCHDVDELERAAAAGGVVIFNPSRSFPGAPERGFQFFCAWVFQVAQVLRGKKVFGSDELDSLVGVASKPDELCIIFDLGRTYQLDCFFIVQAMNALHNSVRKQVSEIFAFRQGDAAGIGWLAEKGFSSSALGALANGCWHYRNLNTGDAAVGGSAFVPKTSKRDLKGL